MSDTVEKAKGYASNAYDRIEEHPVATAAGVGILAFIAIKLGKKKEPSQ